MLWILLLVALCPLVSLGTERALARVRIERFR
jgi:hypothetical protein